MSLPPAPPLHPAERPPEGEDDHISECLRLAREVRAHARTDGEHARGAHAKGIATVRAELRVPDDLPAPLRQGLFAHPGTYPAWVRFSSTSQHYQSDGQADVRGMAIKVLGVPGEKYFTDGPPGSAQDLVFVSVPALPFANVAEINRFMQWDRRGFQGGYFLSWKGPSRVSLVAKHVSGNPDLLVRAWSSGVPYQLGEHVVKYAARLVGEGATVPKKGPDRLRVALAERLQAGPAELELYVQRWTDRPELPIEDASVPWPEELAPLEHVATLRLLQQEVDVEEKRALGERLSFNPWHARLDMKPLGGLNRARRVVYEVMSRERLAANGVEPVEPG